MKKIMCALIRLSILGVIATNSTFAAPVEAYPGQAAYKSKLQSMSWAKLKWEQTGAWIKAKPYCGLVNILTPVAFVESSLPLIAGSLSLIDNLSLDGHDSYQEVRKEQGTSTAELIVTGILGGGLSSLYDRAKGDSEYSAASTAMTAQSVMMKYRDTKCATVQMVLNDISAQLQKNRSSTPVTSVAQQGIKSASGDITVATNEKTVASLEKTTKKDLDVASVQAGK